mmetsp:Transcript_19983/g.40492  ORF Transcript_19983/g.40492 Transcript_19983/m.40492 type:complete len:249 (-) Transcript_19983:73-819(-)
MAALKNASSLRSLLLAHALAISVVFVIIRAALSFRDATDALAFYGVYHREKWNQLIHFFGVPLIIWSLLIFLAHLPLPFFSLKIKIPFAPEHRATYGTMLALFYAIFFLKIDRIGGVLYFPVEYAEYVFAVRMHATDQAEARMRCDKRQENPTWTGTGWVLKVAGLMHFLSWYLQIHLGHMILEGASPAITAGFGAALTSAPLFAFYEGLWLLGINPELHISTSELVAQHTEAMCAAGAAMRVCESLM